jgi:hypothetical protein
MGQATVKVRAAGSVGGRMTLKANAEGGGRSRSARGWRPAATRSGRTVYIFDAAEIPMPNRISLKFMPEIRFRK